MERIPHTGAQNLWKTDSLPFQSIGDYFRIMWKGEQIRNIVKHETQRGNVGLMDPSLVNHLAHTHVQYSTLALKL